MTNNGGESVHCRRITIINLSGGELQPNHIPSIEVKICNSEGSAVRLYIMQKDRPYRDDGASDCMENIDFLYGRVRSKQLYYVCIKRRVMSLSLLQFMERTDYFP